MENGSLPAASSGSLDHRSAWWRRSLSRQATCAAEQEKAAKEVVRTSAVLTHQLAEFAHATINDATDDEVLLLATFVAFARQTGDAARRAIALHKSVVAATGGPSGRVFVSERDVFDSRQLELGSE
eukprot:scaffold98176_cov34-Tisochrysis_lutea.AAC.3